LKKVKLLLLVCAVLVISIALAVSDAIKNTSTKELYENVISAQTAMEAHQYISDIEYDIRYGRDLNNFYNMDETLKDIARNSSYIKGTYIVSAKKKLLYLNGQIPAKKELKIPEQSAFSDKSYAMYPHGAWYFVVSKIKNEHSAVVGYLFIRVAGDAVTNTTADYIEQNNLQTLIIGCEILALAVLVIRRASQKKDDAKKGTATLHSLLRPLCALLMVAVILDASLSLVRFYQLANDATVQVVDKISETMQSRVDDVIAKGIPSDQLYDLSGWLEKNKSEMPVIASFNLQNNEKITATVSQDYINSFLAQSFLRLLLLLAGCLLFCALVLLIYSVLIKYERKSPQRSKTC
jgi:hypothetical protein